MSALAIGPRYFASFGRGPVRGREFTDDEPPAWRSSTNGSHASTSATPIRWAVHPVSPGERRTDPVLRLTVVGVAPNVRQRPTPDRDFDPVVYLPHTAWPLPFATILVRSDAGTAAVTSALRDTMRGLDPDLALYDVRSLDNLIEADRWEGRLLSTIFGLVAVLALTLATVGVYAVTAFAVSRRTREIGVRMALGARARHVYLLVTRGAAVQIAAGIALGWRGLSACAACSIRFSARSTPPTAVTLAVVPALLALSPSWRASCPPDAPLPSIRRSALRAE